MDYQYHEFYKYDDYSNDENRGSLRKVPGEKKLMILISKTPTNEDCATVLMILIKTRKSA